MYIRNGFSAKNKRFYTLPIFFFLLIFISNLFAPKTDYKSLIEEWGELTFFAISVGSFIFFFLGLFFIVKFIHSQSITQFTTGRKRIDFSRILFSFLVWGGIIILQTLISYWLYPMNYQWNFDPERFFYLMILSFIFIPFQAGFEEYFFRGYVLQFLAIITKNKWFPLLISSIYFGVVHIANPEIEQLGLEFIWVYISMGLFLGIITLMDGGLELSLGFHIANNIFIALLTTSSWSAFQTPSLLKDISDPQLDIFTILSFYIPIGILLFIFAKKYKWTNWKFHLFGKIK